MLIKISKDLIFILVGESAVSFLVACLTCIGISVWVIYGAYGLAFWPMNLIRGTKSLKETKNEVS